MELEAVWSKQEDVLVVQFWFEKMGQFRDCQKKEHKQCLDRFLVGEKSGKRDDGEAVEGVVGKVFRGWTHRISVELR